MDGKEKALSIISRDEARAAGMKRFYTGEPCRAGHVDERYVSTTVCCECNRIRSRQTVKAHYKRHKDRILASKRDYYVENAQAIKDRVQQRRTRKAAEQEAAAPVASTTQPSPNL